MEEPAEFFRTGFDCVSEDRSSKTLLLHSLRTSLSYPSVRRKKRRNGCEHVRSTWQVTRHVETLLLQIVEKTFEIPELRFTNKVDIPVVTQRQIRMNPDVQKTTETPQLQHTEQVVDVPVVLVAQVPRVEVVEEAVEISQFQAVRKSV